MTDNTVYDKMVLGDKTNKQKGANMRNFNNLAIVKVVLENFVNEHDIEADPMDVLAQALDNIDENVNVEMSKEVLEILDYLDRNNLVNTFFRT